MNMFQFPPIKNFTEQGIKNAFLKAENIIRFYYIALFYLSLHFGLSRWLSFLSITEVEPLWPVGWIHFVDTSTAVNIIFSLFIVGSLFAIIFPHQRLARTLAFLGFFEFVAFTNSFGKIDHNYHAWILTSFLLIFLPSVKYKLSLAAIYYRKFLLVFWGCQAIVFLIYTMAGIAKIYSAFGQIGRGEIHSFHPQALSLQIANRLLQTGDTTLLGAWLIEHEILGWVLYITSIFLELFAFYITFRPSLHKLWALGLIFMHIGIYLAMPAPFFENVLLLTILFFQSPFNPPKMYWYTPLIDLPIFGLFIKRLAKLPTALRRIIYF